MGDPPSSFGGIHFKSTKFLSQSVTSKLPGLPGSSKKKKKKIDIQ